MGIRPPDHDSGEQRNTRAISSMGQLHEPPPALLILAAFSQSDEALDWARACAVQQYGSVALESPRYDFDQTDYYEPTMGPRLKKTFWLFEPRFDPARLAEVKLQTNVWEETYAKQRGSDARPRPLNLDPGYLTQAKLVLASTKNHMHRIYLRDGIFAEITLHYHDGDWRPWDWTFKDYRRDDYRAFFNACRQHLRDELRRESTT